MLVEQPVLYALGHAAQHTDDEFAALAAHGVEGLEAVYDFLLGIVAHRACVEKYGVGLVKTFARLVAGHFHDRGHHFAVGHIHLAAVCFDIEMFHVCEWYSWLTG